MRLVETDREEEGLILMRLEEFDGLRRDLTVSMVFILASLVRKEGHRGTKTRRRLHDEDITL